MGVEDVELGVGEGAADGHRGGVGLEFAPVFEIGAVDGGFGEAERVDQAGVGAKEAAPGVVFGGVPGIGAAE